MLSNIPAVKDNASGTLASAINASVLTIPLDSGQGANLPQPYNGVTSSLGSDVLLNSTGISAIIGGSGAVGKPIFNATDGSIAFIKSVATDAVTTTPLLGGTDNTWDNGDVWRIDEFVGTLEAISTNAYGVQSVTKREQVLITARTSDNCTVPTGGRGYNGTTAQSFAQGDHFRLLVSSPNHQRIVSYLNELAKREETNRDAIAQLEADLASTANGEGASMIGIEDVDGYFTGDTVEEALTELGESIALAAGLTAVSLTPPIGSPSPLWPCASVATGYQTSTIAFDSATGGTPTTATSLTISHTASGNDRFALVGIRTSTNNTDVVTGVTYGGVAMTRIGTVASGSVRAYLYGVIAPATGAQNVVASLSGSNAVDGVVATYTGVSQFRFPDATNTQQGGGTSGSVSTTTVGDGAWVAAFLYEVSGAAFTGYTGTARVASRNNTIVDNNGPKSPAGAVSLGGTWAANTEFTFVSCSFMPVQYPVVRTFDFDKDVRESAEWLVTLPSNYAGGTVSAKFHWTSSGSGDVVWGVQGVVLSDDDPLASDFGTVQTVTDTLLAANDHHQTAATPAITLAGTPAAGETVVFRVYRDANNAADTLNADAKLIAVEITYL